MSASRLSKSVSVFERTSSTQMPPVVGFEHYRDGPCDVRLSSTHAAMELRQRRLWRGPLACGSLAATGLGWRGPSVTSRYQECTSHRLRTTVHDPWFTVRRRQFTGRCPLWTGREHLFSSRYPLSRHVDIGRRRATQCFRYADKSSPYVFHSPSIFLERSCRAFPEPATLVQPQPTETEIALASPHVRQRRLSREAHLPRPRRPRHGSRSCPPGGRSGRYLPGDALAPIRRTFFAVRDHRRRVGTLSRRGRRATALADSWYLVVAAHLGRLDGATARF